MATDCSQDYLLALRLEAEFALEDANSEVASLIPPEFRKGSPLKRPSARDDPFSSPQPSTSRGLPGRGKSHGASSKESGLSIIAPEWEDLDPTPDLQAMFLQFNDKFFWGKLAACEVKWSPRMTVCAGICSYSPRQGYCSIRLSVPLLKLRPRKDFVETLLHEMIHAYLFVTDGNDDHDGHGPAFHTHMYRINKATGTNISVYHTFHDEVALYKQHWWKCNGPCVSRKPFYGLVKRSMNRAPGPNDLWWKEHQRTCGGAFVKIKEPEGYGQKKSKAGGGATKVGSTGGGTILGKGQKDIRSLFDKTNLKKSPTKKTPTKKTPIKNSPVKGKGKGSFKGSSQTNPGNGGGVSGGGKLSGGGGRGNIFGFGGTSFGSPAGGVTGGGLQTKGKSGSYVVNPGWKAKDNSSGGHVLNGGHNIKQPSQKGASSGTAGRTSSTSSENVRESVRDIWAKKFGGSSTSNSQQPASSSNAGSGGRGATSNFVDLTKSPPPATSPFGKQVKQSTAPCPVCNKQVPQSVINSHLDECLNMSALSQGEHSPPTVVNSPVKKLPTGSIKTSTPHHGKGKPDKSPKKKRPKLNPFMDNDDDDDFI